MGGGRRSAPGRARAQPRTRASPPRRLPLCAPRPAGLQSRRSLRGQPRRWSRAGAGAGGGPAPLPPLCSPEPGTGAERARLALLLLLLLASGKPRRSDPPPVLPPPAPNLRERLPLTSAGSFKGCGDLRQSREPARTSLLRASI